MSFRSWREMNASGWDPTGLACWLWRVHHQGVNLLLKTYPRCMSLSSCSNFRFFMPAEWCFSDCSHGVRLSGPVKVKEEAAESGYLCAICSHWVHYGFTPKTAWKDDVGTSRGEAGCHLWQPSLFSVSSKLKGLRYKFTSSIIETGFCPTNLE